MKVMRQKFFKKLFPLFICFLFFVAYATISVVRHLHFGSFGFDLGITDQIVWKYSQFKAPITTVHHYAFTSIFTDHIEFIYLLVAPLYWMFNTPVTLLVLQAFFVIFSGVPIYFFARKRGINTLVSFSLLVSYLSFYGIQNALWFDVQSLAFGVGFLSWFLYFLDTEKHRAALIFFVLTLLCKEDMALLTLLISFSYVISRKSKFALVLMVLSAVYLYAIFYIYFPHFTQDGYRFASKNGLLYGLKPEYFVDTGEKRQVIFASLAWFGFLPLFAPLFLIPAIGDLAHYFVLGHLVTTAQGFFMHYRIALASLLLLPTIIAISTYKALNKNSVALYILCCALFFQYTLHLPLSYLVKQWFWQQPASAKNINALIGHLPPHASVVSQNNITSHISHRDNIFTLYPEVANFSFANSPCGKPTCDWFHWSGNPEFLIVDTSSDWDSRHLLADSKAYKAGLHNLESAGYIKVYKQIGESVLYKILKQP